jgi:hypothetical protein
LKISKLIAPAIALIIMAAACGSKTQTLPQYFDRFAAITSVMDQKTQDLQTKADSALMAAKTNADRLKVLFDSLEEQVAVVGAAVTQWNSLDPPDEVKAAHDAYVAAVDTYVKGMTASLRGFDKFKTIQEAQDAILTPELQRAGTTIDAGCAKLQGVAASQKIQVDLGCSGGSSANAGG